MVYSCTVNRPSKKKHIALVVALRSFEYTAKGGRAVKWGLQSTMEVLIGVDLAGILRLMSNNISKKTKKTYGCTNSRSLRSFAKRFKESLKQNEMKSVQLCCGDQEMGLRGCRTPQRFCPLFIAFCNIRCSHNDFACGPHTSARFLHLQWHKIYKPTPNANRIAETKGIVERRSAYVWSSSRNLEVSGHPFNWRVKRWSIDHM